MDYLKPTLPQKIKKHSLLYVLAAFCIALLLIRAWAAHSTFYFFLVWNLFLAFVPLAISSLMVSSITLMENKRRLYPALLIWLLLLPNAPYIITDLVHLTRETNVPTWFDVLLLASFILSGLLFALSSMKHIYTILLVQFSQSTATLAMMVTCMLCGLGMYVGRFLRYNSWDVLTHPLSVVIHTWHSFFGAATCRPALGITLGFGTLLYLLFSLYNERNH